MVVICPPLDGFQRITKDVPLRVSAGTFLDIAGVCLMSQFPERNAHRLRLLTRYEYLQTQSPPSPDPDARSGSTPVRIV